MANVAAPSGEYLTYEWDDIFKDGTGGLIADVYVYERGPRGGRSRMVQLPPKYTLMLLEGMAFAYARDNRLEEWWKKRKRI